MKKALWVGVLGQLVLAPVTTHATTMNLYTVGSNPAGEARDDVGNPIGGIPSISWAFNVADLGTATLSSWQRASMVVRTHPEAASVTRSTSTARS